MRLVSIHDLKMNLLVDAEAHLDRERVERFTIVLDEMPPVVVFDTPEGLRLVRSDTGRPVSDTKFEAVAFVRARSSGVNTGPTTSVRCPG